LVNIFLKSVSKPIETNATENSVSLSAFAAPPSDFAVAGSRKKLNTTEASIKPRTNFGNLSQRIEGVGFISVFVPL
jgi:hypothetical protein